MRAIARLFQKERTEDLPVEQLRSACGGLSDAHFATPLARLDDENNLLARKQFGFQRTHDHATAEQEEEYEEFCAEAWFRIQILEQRLARHEDQALQKFAYLDTKLRNDPRLSAIHDYS